MGNSAWSSNAYRNITTSYTSKSADQIFTNTASKTLDNTLDPNGVKFRESRDSDAHPNTLGVMVFLDVTGSMGKIPEKMAREKLGTLMNTLVGHGINDAQILFGAIGDHHTDYFPLQLGQFESGTDELDKCLTAINLEGNGGGQMKESYLLAWLTAARHTSMDCFEKRGEKGILFTIGDEASWDRVDVSSLKKLMGYAEAEDISDEAILAEAQRTFHVFHIHVDEGSYSNEPTIINYWKKLLKENLIILKDYNQVAEVIATTVAMAHGLDIDKATSGFDSKTAGDVKTALMHIDTTLMKKNQDQGVVTL